ncbi:hypothetical protein JCGZ_19935 [Jatropha curcas]|uniref:TFIIB-type domain-containing protein n=1 Tax=Jatropha curcas TaxID=180498 RepID=A0A067JTH1_JATCU|nr:hypothetical protein JCGZ_19935 [Jatropha curcas]
MESRNDISYCMDCKRNTEVVLDHSSGDTICTVCALVLEHHFIDEGSEWRSFADDKENNKDPNRVGAACNPLFSSGNYSTIIISKHDGGNGSAADIMATTRRMQALTNPDKDIAEGFEVIATMADRLSIVKTIKDRACEIYKDVLGKSCKGKKLSAIMGACLFIACRETKSPRTLKEICSAIDGVSKKEIVRAVETIRKLVDVESGILNTSELVRRFCSNLSMNSTAMKAVQEALEKSQEIDIRRTPKSILAAIIYIINQLSDKKIPLRDIAMVTEVAEGTIKKSYKDMYPHASRLIPHWYAKEKEVFNKLCHPSNCGAKQP